MFNNLINLHDCVVLFEKAREPGNARVFKKFLRATDRRIAQTWSHTEGGPTQWWDIPAVEQRWNALITGDSTHEPYSYVASRYFSDTVDRRALSLGCGAGGRELKWLATGKITRIDAYDISPERIARAQGQAAEAGAADRVSFRVANVFDLEIHSETYDVVLLESALHHFTPLRDILLSVSRWVKAGGYIIVNEFVGPSRFQWTSRQLEIVNGILPIIPPRYRRMVPDGKIKTRVYRPGRLSMYLNDPSEAAESSLILPLLHEMFVVVELKEYGGTLLPLALKNIAHNFIAQDEDSLRWLTLLFDIEDELLRCKEIESDYVYAVCRKHR